MEDVKMECKVNLGEVWLKSLNEGKAIRLTCKEKCPDVVLGLVRCLDRSIKASPTERYRLLTVMNQGVFRAEGDRVFTVVPVPTASNTAFVALNRMFESAEVV